MQTLIDRTATVATSATNAQRRATVVHIVIDMSVGSGLFWTFQVFDATFSFLLVVRSHSFSLLYTSLLYTSSYFLLSLALVTDTSSLSASHHPSLIRLKILISSTDLSHKSCLPYRPCWLYGLSDCVYYFVFCSAFILFTLVHLLILILMLHASLGWQFVSFWSHVKCLHIAAYCFVWALWLLASSTYGLAWSSAGRTAIFVCLFSFTWWQHHF